MEQTEEGNLDAQQRKEWAETVSAVAAGELPLAEARAQQAVDAILDGLDTGTVRVAEKIEGTWRTHAWVKQAILLYFRMRRMETWEVGPFEYRDKIPLKRNLEAQGVRVVPPGVARYGSFLEEGVILMPGYVNLGARVGRETMIDTWATVGSCAQIGRGVHLSGGVGIGGVLEPPQAQPVIVEDHAFVGSRCIVVEGVVVEEGAVLGAGCVLTASTPVVDVRGARPAVSRGRIPARTVAIPGTQPKRFPAGEFAVPCVLLIGDRKPSTNEKTSLEEALREYGVAV